MNVQELEHFPNEFIGKLSPVPNVHRIRIRFFDAIFVNTCIHVSIQANIRANRGTHQN